MMIIEPNDNEADDEDAEGQRQEIVGLVRRARDMEEEDEVDAHLRDGEHRQQDRRRRARRSRSVDDAQNDASVRTTA